MWLPLKFMNDLKELFLSELRKGYFNWIMSRDRGYRLSHSIGHTCPPKPRKKNNLLEWAYFERQLFQLFTLATGSFLSLVQIFQNRSTFQFQSKFEIDKILK